ncbi:hypothetical protein Tco_0560500 [Tanacetum coccineum]
MFWVSTTKNLDNDCCNGRGLARFVLMVEYLRVVVRYNNNNNNKDVDGVVKFVLYDITKPQVASSSVQLAHGRDSVLDEHDGFTLPLLDSLLSKGLRTVKSIPPKCRLGFSRVLKGALNKVICTPDDISCWVSLLVLPLCLLKTFCSRNNLECKSGIKRQRQEESIVNAIRSWGIPGGSLQLVREALAEPSISWSNNDEENLDLGKRNVKQCKMKICDGHYTAAVRVLSSSRVAPYNDATLEDLKAKHPFKPASSLPHIPIDHHQLIASPAVVLEMIKSFPRGTSCSRDGLRAQHLMDCLSGAVITSLFRGNYNIIYSIRVPKDSKKLLLTKVKSKISRVVSRRGMQWKVESRFDI